MSITRAIFASGNRRTGKVSGSTEITLYSQWETFVDIDANRQTYVLFFVYEIKMFHSDPELTRYKTSSVKYLNLNFDINKKCWVHVK